MSTDLIITSILLGVGLAMDAFSVSLADGLSEEKLNAKRVLVIAGTFAFFQFLMPLTGWVLVHTAEARFQSFQTFVPWIALALLLYIGGKMLIEGVRDRKERIAAGSEPDQTGIDAGSQRSTLGAGELLIQGIATSIDALSVGFTIASYAAVTAFASSAIIGAVTLIICIAGLLIGRQIGTRFSGSASILGGVILIAIGIEIWVKGFLL